MEYPLGHTIRFRDREDAVRGGGEQVTRTGVVNGDSLEANDGVFYPVWVDDLANTVYVHFDNIIED